MRTSTVPAWVGNIYSQHADKVRLDHPAFREYDEEGFNELTDIQKAAAVAHYLQVTDLRVTYRGAEEAARRRYSERVI